RSAPCCCRRRGRTARPAGGACRPPVRGKARVRRKGGECVVGVENHRVVETKEGIDAPVMEEPETPHLGTFRAVVAGVEERNRWHAEHADLLVGVPEVRDLEELGLVLEAREAVGAEEAEGRVEKVAAVAGLERVRG